MQIEDERGGTGRCMRGTRPGLEQDCHACPPRQEAARKEDALGAEAKDLRERLDEAQRGAEVLQQRADVAQSELAGARDLLQSSMALEADAQAMRVKVAGLAARNETLDAEVGMRAPPPCCLYSLWPACHPDLNAHLALARSGRCHHMPRESFVTPARRIAPSLRSLRHARLAATRRA